MDKNSINQVARTYQRLVEAAITPKTPPMPLEAPDADKAFVGPPAPYPDLNRFQGEVYNSYETLYNQVVAMLEYCLDNPGACSKQQMNTLNMLLQYYTNLLLTPQPDLEGDIIEPDPRVVPNPRQYWDWA